MALIFNPAFTEENPNAGLPEIAKIAGAAWKEISAEEKQKHEDAYLEELKEWKVKMENYKPSSSPKASSSKKSSQKVSAQSTSKTAKSKEFVSDSDSSSEDEKGKTEAKKPKKKEKETSSASSESDMDDWGCDFPVVKILYSGFFFDSPLLLPFLVFFRHKNCLKFQKLPKIS